MVLSPELSSRIVNVACEYLGTSFVWETFNCAHFVFAVYGRVGIQLPTFERYGLPPREFHLSEEEFRLMPRGHLVFFKRKDTKVKQRYWTHMAIIIGHTSLIHCTRHLGNGVVISQVQELLSLYDLAVSSK